MSNETVGHITKRRIGIRRISIRKPHKDALRVAYLGKVIKHSAETEHIGQVERVEVALRPAERTDVDNLIMMMLVFLIVLLVVLRGQPNWNRQRRE